MRIYIVAYNEHHKSSDIIGVYTTVIQAEEAWRCVYTSHQPINSECESYDIREFEVRVDKEEREKK